MTQIFDFFLEAYKATPTYQIVLEAIAFVFGILSVWYAKKENILVYPTGIICTVITVYLLYINEYFGDMMMNFYYSVMSIYGWWNWSRKKEGKYVLPISITNTTTYKYLIILIYLHQEFSLQQCGIWQIRN